MTSPGPGNNNPTVRPTRRGVLAACGAGLTALAGCASVDLSSRGRDDDREYDAERLAALAERGTPTPRNGFPVAITVTELDRHRDRARDLVSIVPDRPDIPNGAVAEQLRTDRERVRDDLAGDGESAGDDERTDFDRLADVRRVRADAAEVAGAYRAATRAIHRRGIEARREALREDRRAFEAEWAYRGDDAAGALVVGAALEDLLERARRGAEAWPSFPDDPAADVFRVGEITRTLEAGRAALADAVDLRTRYLNGGSDAPSHRGAIAAAAHRLRDRTLWNRQAIHEYLDADVSALPFNRRIEGTPAAELYRRARLRAEDALRGPDRARRSGEHATATLQGARGIASLRAFEAVIEALEAGEYGPPENAEHVATAHEAAVDALGAAWRTAPTAVSVKVAAPARWAVGRGLSGLERSDGHHRDVDRAVASFGYARLYAEAVPVVIGTVVEVLEDGR